MTPPPLPTTMDQQMTSSPMEPMQGIADSGGGTAMETSTIPDLMPPNPTNYSNHHSSASEMPSINGHHQTPYQPGIYKTMQSNNNNGSNNNNNNENHKHDNNQNFVHDLNMYGNRSNNNYRPQDIPTQLQSDVQMTGADPMMNSTAIIQNNNTPTTFARKITRSMHQQNLMHLQHGINGGAGGGSNFKVELKDEPENGF